MNASPGRRADRADPIERCVTRRIVVPLHTRFSHTPPPLGVPKSAFSLPPRPLPAAVLTSREACYLRRKGIPRRTLTRPPQPHDGRPLVFDTIYG